MTLQWTEYDTFKGGSEFVVQYYQSVHKCLIASMKSILEKPVGRALDIACGHGDSTRILKPFADEIVGVDSSQELIRLAKEQNPSSGFQFECATFQGFQSECGFDLITATWFLNHLISESDLQQAISKIRALLNPGGAVFFVVPSDAFTSRRTQVIAHQVQWVQAWTEELLDRTTGVFRFGTEWIPTTIWQPLFLMRLLGQEFEIQTWDVKTTMVREQLLPQLVCEPPFEIIYGTLKD